MTHGWQRRAIAGLGGTLAACAVLLGVACGDDEGGADEEAIEQTINDVAAAWDAQDWESFKALHTEAGLMAQLADAEDPNSEEGLKEAFDQFSADDTFKVHSIDDVSVSGDTATADVVAYTESREAPAFSSIALGTNVSLVEVEGAWKVDGLEFTSPEVPEGTTSVHVDANEFAFGFNPEDIDSGDVAFEVANVGEQPHHFVLEQVPADLDIEAALASEDEPEGLIHIGSTPPWEPGETYNIVFTNELEPGRYVMLCFMPDTEDPEGPPHAVKGMWKDFTIE